MKWLCLILGAVFGLIVNCVLAESPKEQPGMVTVPREAIRYGNNVSRELRDLEPEFFFYIDTPEKRTKYSTPEGIEELKRHIQRTKEKSLVYALERAMSALPAGKNAQAGPGFAVRGRDKAALREVYDVFVKGAKPEVRFPEGSEISIVFYSLPVQALVRLDQVQRDGNVVRIHYTLVQHGRMFVNWNLDLIPLGKLPEGTYSVQILGSTDESRLRNNSSPQPLTAPARTVSKPFEFVVTDQPVEVEGMP